MMMDTMHLFDTIFGLLSVVLHDARDITFNSIYNVALTNIFYSYDAINNDNKYACTVLSHCYTSTPARVKYIIFIVLWD